MSDRFEEKMNKMPVGELQALIEKLEVSDASNLDEQERLELETLRRLVEVALAAHGDELGSNETSDLMGYLEPVELYSANESRTIKNRVGSFSTPNFIAHFIQSIFHESIINHRRRNIKLICTLLELRFKGQLGFINIDLIAARMGYRRNSIISAIKEINADERRFKGCELLTENRPLRVKLVNLPNLDMFDQISDYYSVI